MNELTKYRLNLTRQLRTQNAYTTALDGEFRTVAFNEERAPENRGQWRQQVFGASADATLDLEIGTGNGTHFRHHALKNPDRLLVGLEIKYKPLIQTIRSAVKAGAKNAAVARFHAFELPQVFAPLELDNVYVHFPDPWTSPRKPKNRIIQKKTLEVLWELQKPGSKIEFKTDSEEAFLWCEEEFRAGPYKVEFLTRDLHRSELATENFVTTFEKIFLREGLKIHFVRLRKE